MAHGIHNFTVQEAQNIQIGQCKSAYINDTTIYTANSSERIVAVQIIQDAKFNALTEELPDECIGSTASNNTGGSGDAVANTSIIPAGIVLYGRWTAVQLVSGIVALYIAGK